MLFKIMVLAALVESMMEVFKWAFSGELNKWRIIAFVSGLLVTPLTGLDLFAAVGIPLTVPYIDPNIGAIMGATLGWIFTGAIVSRGSNVVNDLFTLLSKLRTAFTQIKDLPENGQ